MNKFNSFALGAVFALSVFTYWNTQQIEHEMEVISPVVHSVAQAVDAEPEHVYFQGKVSWYGEADSECLDCREDRIMANGDRFNEDENTLAIGVLWDGDRAIPLIPLNTKVIVRNLENGREAGAVVTDTGGFYTEQYGNRIADLSKGLAELLDIETGKSEVQILEYRGK